MTPRPRQGRWRLLALLVLLTSGLGLSALFWRERTAPPLPSSVSAPIQLIGKPIHLIDRLASLVVPVGSVDERELGDTIRRHFESQLEAGDRTQAYLDALMEAQLRLHTRRPFPYRAYRIGSIGAANATALPGGVILISDEMLELLGSEAELIAILAHEIGHIELGHCFDRVRFQLLLRRTGLASLGELADAAIGLLLQSGYSQSAENEADNYAFNLLLNSPYDPSALGEAFHTFNQRKPARAPAPRDPLREAVSSHPPGPLREAQFEQRAQAWWASHRQERRYRGRPNLEQRIPLNRAPKEREWITRKPDSA